MSSSKILAPRSLLPPFRPTLGTHSPAHHIAESRHVTDMAAVFTVCLCTANSGPSLGRYWNEQLPKDDDPTPDASFKSSHFRKYPTMGPQHRYAAVLFIEKEGFAPLLRAARIAERFDIAIMSTKGMSTTAARQLL